MQPDDVRELYDHDTARTYNERWHGSPWGNDTEILAEAIGRRVQRDVRWLDVGCGTGHFLSRFPGIERSGTDLSPSMLAQARMANPDAQWFQEWDFRVDNPEWHDRFTLVTCTGEPWSYVDTIEDTERFVENVSRWTAPGGTFLLAVQDPLDLTGVALPHVFSSEPGMPGEIIIEAVVWSLVDRSHEHVPDIGIKEHHHMVWPILEHWVRMFGEFFRTIIVESLPHDPPWLHTPRRVLIAKDKRAPGDLTPTNVIHSEAQIPYVETVAPSPPPAFPGPSEHAPPPPPPAAEPPAPAPPPEPAPEPQQAPVSEAVAPAPESAATADDATAPDPEPRRPVRLRDKTVGELVHKARPWDARFWRRTGRYVTRR